MRYATLGFDVKTRLGLVEMVWVTAKQSNNKARGRAAHPGAIRSITASTLKGLHSLEENKKGQAQQFRDSQNWIRQLSLHQKLSTNARWAAHETLRREVAKKKPLADAQLAKKNGD